MVQMGLKHRHDLLLDRRVHVQRVHRPCQPELEHRQQVPGLLLDLVDLRVVLLRGQVALKGDLMVLHDQAVQRVAQ
jgi:hypothetical protein